MTIKNILSLLLAINITILFFVGFAYFSYKTAQDKVSNSYKNQFQSYLLADELRQSSDDLTRLGRTYALTGNIKYEKQYFNILNRRNGKKARPEDYHRIYWDLYTINMKKPRPDSKLKISLTELMKQANFSNEEFNFLEQATNNSNGLVKLEIEAMNAVKGLFKDSYGEYTTKGDANFALAGKLLHSIDYHKFKANIVTPLDKFYQSLEKRSKQQIATAEANGRIWQITLLAMIACLATVMAITAFTCYKRIILPLLSMKNAMNKISQNDLDITIPALDKNDEIGEMAKALEIFKIGSIDRIKMEKAKKIKQRQDEGRSKQLNDMNKQFITRFDNAISEIFSYVSSLNDKSSQMSNIVSQSKEQALHVVNISQSTSSNVETVTVATQELSSSIAEIATQVTKSADIISSAVIETQETNVQVQGLKEAAQKIDKVVLLISEIADQTNLLALNATIESARAGDAGKGFAVVASEVKNLANETAQATEEISTQINEIQNATEDAIKSITNIVKTIGNIDRISSNIAAGVEQQDAATRDISNNIKSAANGSLDVNKNIKTIDMSIDKISQINSDVSSSSKDILDKSNELKEMLGNYMNDIKSIDDARYEAA